MHILQFLSPDRAICCPTLIQHAIYPIMEMTDTIDIMMIITHDPSIPRMIPKALARESISDESLPSLNTDETTATSLKSMYWAANLRNGVTQIANSYHSENTDGVSQDPSTRKDGFGSVGQYLSDNRDRV